MSTNVDPNKVEELAVEFKRLSRIIEDGETSVNKDIMDLIQETNSQYTESYVRSTTSQMESLLKEIRMLAVSITERLNDKSNVLKRAAEQYRHDEEEARKLLQKPVGFSLGRLIGGAFGNFFKKIGDAIVAVINKAIEFIFGKGKNKYREPTLDLPLEVTPLKANLLMNTNVYSEEVKKLQQKLKDLGYDIEVDGYFGEQTLGVVNTYKDKYGLANTGKYNGVVDDQMWVYLFGSLSGELKLSPGMYSEEVRIAQIRLKDLGYDVEITGYFDDKTLKAVNELKEGNKLGNTGKWEGVIGPQTWGVLFGAGVKAAVTSNITSTEKKAGIAGSNNVVDEYHKELDQLPSVPSADANESITGTKEQSGSQNEGTGRNDWITEVMQLNGTSEAEQYLTSRVKSLNSRISNKDLKWNQEKISQIWDASQIVYDEYGIQADPRLLLAIIFQEGTGSFNTSATNLAADGQHGVETDFAKDLMKANNLVFGKILGYAYYGGDFNKSVASNNNKAGISGNGNFLQYANWNTPIIDLDGGYVRYGVYAGHGAWHEGVGGMYEKLSYDGASSQYSAYLSSVNKEAILNATNGISLPNVVFTPSQTSQDYRGNPNGKYIIQGKAIRYKED